MNDLKIFDDGTFMFKENQIGEIFNNVATIYLTEDNFENCEFETSYIQDLLSNKDQIVKQLKDLGYKVEIEGRLNMTTIYAIRIGKLKTPHPVWKTGQFLYEQEPVEEDFGPGNWLKLSPTEQPHMATFYPTETKAWLAKKNLWHYGDGKELEIVKFVLV